MVHNFHPICHTWIRIQPLAETGLLFSKRENGDTYVTLSHETKQTNWQGGIDYTENLKEKGMCAVPSAKKNVY